MRKTLLLVLILATIAFVVNAERLWLPAPIAGLRAGQPQASADNDYTTDAILIQKYAADVTYQPDASPLGTSTGILGAAGARPTWTNANGGGYYFVSGDYIDMGDKDVFTHSDGTNDRKWSYAIRMKPTTLAGGSQYKPFGKRDTTSKCEYTMAWNGNPYQINSMQFDAIFDDRLRSRTTGFLTVNDDLTIIGTCDASGSSAGLKLYTNGIAAPATQMPAGSYTAMENTTAALRLGMMEDTEYAYAGWVYELRIYTNELTTGQVSTVHNAMMAR